MQATIWRLFDPAAPAPRSSFWADRAKENYASMVFTDFRVVTNTGPVEPTGQIQEFIARKAAPGGVPEPVTLLSMGSGLAAMAALWRKKARRT
ncbi:MAG: PEP-CTERM sorting domain-containing protein [Acidobacteriota bacterium]|nr:PEP-CTERM sorting domain-containing protein [Acidobacteriota bacterium]